MRMRPVIVALTLTLLLGLPGPAAATSIPFSVSVIDFGAPSTFVFTFTVPTFITGPTVATVSLSGTLTDGGVDGVSLTPTLPDSDGDGISEILVASAFAGGLVNLGVDIGPATTTAGAYGPFSLGPEAGPSPGPVTELSLSLAFSFSGGNDEVSLSGLLTLDPAPVPELGTLWLLVPSIAAIALRHRRR